MKACKQIRTRIELAADARLSFEDELLVEEHIEHCSRCRAFHAQSRTLEDTLATLAARRTPRPDVERAVRSIRQRTAPSIATQGHPFPFKRVAAAAALLLVTLTLVTVLSPDRAILPEPEPDVASPGPVHVPVHVPDAPAPLLATSDLDPSLLNTKREEVLAHVAAAAAEVDPEADADRFVERLEERLSELIEDEWPVRRIVAGALDSDDERLAAAAARYLGQRGDVPSLSALIETLKHDDAAQFTREAIATALVDASGRDLRGLERSVWLKGLAVCAQSDELFAITLPVLEGLESKELLEWIDDRVRHRDASCRRVAPLLVRHGDEGAERLYDLAAVELLDQETAVDLFARCSGTESLIERAIARNAPRRDTDLVLRIIASHPTEASLAWVVEQCESRRHAHQALRTLGAFESTDAFFELARLSASPLVNELMWLDAVRGRVESRPELATRAAVEIVAERRGERARVVADTLVLIESPASVPALLELARPALLEVAGREALLLAVRDLASPEHTQAIADTFALVASESERLAALCLVTLHDLAGEEAVSLSLASYPERTRSRINRHLSRSDGRTKTGVILIKVTRELKSSARDSKYFNRSSS